MQSNVIQKLAGLKEWVKIYHDALTAYPNSELRKRAIENGCAKALREVNEQIVDVQKEKFKKKKMEGASGYNK